MPRSRVSSLVKLVLGTVSVALKVAFVAFAIATPLFAIWTASSLTAYHGGRIWVAALVGGLVFPGVPLSWELVALWRRSGRADARPPILTTFDRFVLRSLIVGLGFTAVVLVRDPATVFTALSTRGDWMLDGGGGPIVDPIRNGLVRAARTLEWLHEATHRNRYSELVDESATRTTSDVKPVEDELAEIVERLRSELPTTTDDAPKWSVGRKDGWPFVEELHPAVLAMPVGTETSPAAIGRHLADVEPDLTLRLKAVHDYVADRISYDAVAYRTGQYPDQSAAHVLATGRGVCAGYSNLVAEIGNAAGIETVVVVGDVRDGGNIIGDDGHAWNAARLGDHWVLLDATWDAGHLGEEFEKEYSTQYLMAPPSAFGSDHLPEEERWQLRDKPLSRAEFLRQPSLRPAFFARGLQLRNPTAPVVTTGSVLEVDIDNPLGVGLQVDIAHENAMINFTTCEGGAPARCSFDAPGTYQVRMFADREFVGQILVHSGAAASP